MRSTMMAMPLQVARLLSHGSTVHGGAESVTWTGVGSPPRRTTFVEIGQLAAQLASALRDLDVTADERVATLMWNGVEHVIAQLAVPSMGAVLHPLNARLSPTEMATIVNDAADHVVLVDAALVPLLASVLPHTRTVRHVIVTGGGDVAPLRAASRVAAPTVAIHTWHELLADRPHTFAWPVVDENDAAALCYTSGTTAAPRAVAYSHRSIWLHSMQACAAEGFRLTPSTRYLVLLPMFHAMAAGIVYAAFMSGASLVLPHRFLQAEQIAAMIAAERPTMSGAVPTVWNSLLAYLDTHPTDTSSLRTATVGGSACPPALMHAMADRHGINLLHSFGMTESSPYVAVARPPAGVDETRASAYRYSHGRIPAGVQARIVSPSGDLLPADGTTTGELEIRGPWITGRYLGDDPPDPARFRDGWLRTGDIGTLSPDGFLALTDRAGDMIKSGGEWISSVELENILAGHPAVAEVCVIGVPDDRWGERPLATVVLRLDATTSPEELRGFMGRAVSRWQVPEHWAFMPAIPKTSVGKYDKKRLRADYASGALDHS